MLEQLVIGLVLFHMVLAIALQIALTHCIVVFGTLVIYKQENEGA